MVEVIALCCIMLVWIVSTTALTFVSVRSFAIGDRWSAGASTVAVLALMASAMASFNVYVNQ